MNREGWVSIWFFQREGTNADDVLRDIFHIDNYNIAMQDVVGEANWDALPVTELLRRLSYSATFAEAVLLTANARGIFLARRALAQYDFEYDPSKAAIPTKDDPIFIAAVRYGP